MSGEWMRFPFFLIGFVIIVAASIVIGIVAGFETWELWLFVAAVVIITQVVYVGFVALLAFGKKRDSSSRNVSGAKPTARRVPQKPDA